MQLKCRLDPQSLGCSCTQAASRPTRPFWWGLRCHCITVQVIFHYNTLIAMDRRSHFTAMKTNDNVACRFMSHVNTFCRGLHCPYWHSLINNATPCALATYTHPCSHPLTQKDVHVSLLPARLPYLDQNISSIIVCLSDGSVSYSQTNDTRGQHTVLCSYWSSSAVRLAELDVIVHSSPTKSTKVLFKIV